MRKFAATLLAGIMAAGAQQQPAPPPQQPSAAEPGVVKFSTSLNLVVETITVNDKDGKAIDNLKAEDFTVTENGTPQKLVFCEFQRLWRELVGSHAP